MKSKRRCDRYARSIQLIRRVSSGCSIMRWPMDATEEARAALAEIERSLPDDAASVRQMLPWALGEPGTDGPELRAALANAPGNQARFTSSRDRNRRLQRRHRESRSDTPGLLFANLHSSKPAGQAMLRDRGSRRGWSATASRPIGAKKAGQPDAVHWARRISNAALMPGRRVDMSLLTGWRSICELWFAVPLCILRNA